MKIVLVHSGVDFYGASRSLLRLASRLAADGVELVAVTPGEGPLTSSLRSAGVTVDVMPRLAIITRPSVRSPVQLAKLLVDCVVSTVQLVKLIQRSRPDLVHSNTAVVLTAGLASRLSRTPHVWHIRESFHEFGGLWPIYRRYIAACSDMIMCVSQAISDQFGPHHDKVVTINNGFPASEFEPPDPAEIRSFRDSFDLANCDVVSVIGRIKLGRKGQDTFVRAARLLKEGHPDTKFLCVGTAYEDNASHTPALEALIRDLDLEDRVLLIGELSDPRPAIAASDIVVLPSGTPEPFAGVVIEAMALARPVVGTDIGGTPEQIEHGVTGLLVPPNQPQPLADAIAALLDSEAQRLEMGERGRQRFLELFEFESFYKRMLSLYEGVVAGP